MNQPKFEGIDSVYKSKADNKDIRDLLEKLVPKAKGQMVEFSKRFKGATDEQTCRNIFNYLMNHFTYLADGEEQIIKLPSALLKKKIGDCKSYSLFTASVLENLSIPYTIVYTSYNSNPIPQHVYIITQKGCIIDAVYGKFNQEKPPTFKYKKNMNVRYMAGINGNCGCRGNCGCSNGIAGKEERQAKRAEKKEVRQERREDRKENRQETKEKIKAGLKKVGQGAKTIGLAGPRNFILLLIKQNYDGLASKLQSINTEAFSNKWKELGGNRTILTKIIKEGASKPAKKLGLLPSIKKGLGSRINGIGETEIPASIKAAIVTAFTAAGTALGAKATAAAGAATGGTATAGGAGTGGSIGAAAGGLFVSLLPTILSLFKKVPDTESTTIADSDQTGGNINYNELEKNSSSGSGLPKNTLLYAGGALALAAGIYFATKKK
jgi:hypothetical protein